MLKAAIWALRNDEDIQQIIIRMDKEFFKGKSARRGWARSYYRRAIEHLRDAALRDQVFAREKFEQDMMKAETMLWATRAENLHKYVVQ